VALLQAALQLPHHALEQQQQVRTCAVRASLTWQEGVPARDMHSKWLIAEY
jgi:hypothetical protein